MRKNLNDIIKFNNENVVIDIKHNKSVDWDQVSEHLTLSEEFIEKYSDKLNWKLMWDSKSKIPEKLFDKLKRISWKKISMNQKLSEEFIEKYADKLDWKSLAMNQKLSEKFINKHIDKFSDYNLLLFNQKLSEEFINKHFNKFRYLSDILADQKLSDKFIKKHIKYFDKPESNNLVQLNCWRSISRFQKLSEEFIEKYADKLDWDLLSEYQKLSESFIRKYHKKVNWTHILFNQKLSEEFIRKSFSINPIKKSIASINNYKNFVTENHNSLISDYVKMEHLTDYQIFKITNEKIYSYNKCFEKLDKDLKILKKVLQILNK